jgi:hypothetical protein
MSRWIVALVVLAAFAAWAGCRAPTEVTLELSTDTCGAYQGTRITVGPAGQAIESKDPLTITRTCNGDGTIGTFVVVPSGNRDGQFEVLVVTGVDVPSDQCTPPAYKGCIVARRVMTFVPHTPLELPIEMLADCKDVPCDALSTCVNKACVPAAVPHPNACTGRVRCHFDATGYSIAPYTTLEGSSYVVSGTDVTVGLEDGATETAELACITACTSLHGVETATLLQEIEANICFCPHCTSECSFCGSGSLVPAVCIDCALDVIQAGLCTNLVCAGAAAPVPGAGPEGVTDDGGDAEAGSDSSASDSGPPGCGALLGCIAVTCADP